MVFLQQHLDILQVEAVAVVPIMVVDLLMFLVLAVYQVVAADGVQVLYLGEQLLVLLDTQVV